MASGASALSVGQLKQRWMSPEELRSWLPRWSSAAALRGARAAIVMPSLFAISDKLIGNLQMALFAAFGSFATLVLVSFTGARREKLIAHLTLALAGSVLLSIGTAVTSSTAVAAAVTVPVTFAVFFVGVAGPNAASGVSGALLAYVLPAATPGTIGMIPDRLAGWWLASIVGTAAVLVVATPASGSRVREAVSNLTSALADEIDAVLGGVATEALLQACVNAKHELLTQFNATPYRPTGLAIPEQALARGVELLEWCTSLIIDSVRERGDLHDAPAAERDLLEVAAVVLRQSGALFAGGDTRPDLDLLEQRRRQSTERLHSLRTGGEDFRAQAQLAFHTHAVAATALAIGADALLAAGLATEDWLAEARTRWFGGEPIGAGDERHLAGLYRYGGIAVRHASLRSVWFINSMRGALALAAAVAVADLSSVQHGFWVVLGTLSVLRTSAASTGATALRAILGTAAGFAVGAALLLAIGSTSTALWVVLPVAVLVAAYAPGVAPFAVGQAAFTVTVAILFNLLVPVGWKVGELRIEDVAIGCAVSVVVGSLFWPRGVASLVGDDLADAYRSGASYLTQAIAWVCARRNDEPTAARTSMTAALRLDEALRGFLTEQGTKHLKKEDLWRLVGGTLRLRLTAHAVAGLPRDCAEATAASREVLGQRAEMLDAWYDQLAALLGRPRGHELPTLWAPPVHGDDGDGGSGSHQTVWFYEHLDHLTEHLGELVQPAARVAEIRRRPWWR